MKSRIALLFLLLICLGVGSMSGAIFTIENCPSCDGASYSLNNTLFSSTDTTETYFSVLTVNTSGYTGGGSYLYGVGIKIASTLLNVELIDAPTSVPVGSGWDTFYATLNADGCGNGGSGFACIQSTGNGATISTAPGTSYIFNMFLTVSTGTLLNEMPGKAVYNDTQGNKVGWIFSDELMPRDNPVPEPIAFVLMGGGLIVIAVLRRHGKQ